MGMKLITIPLIVGILIIPIINSSGSVIGVTQEDNFVNLTKDDKIFPINHRVAVSESNVFVVWADNTAPASNNSNYDNQDIFFTKSADGGNSFGKIINLSNNRGNSNIPQISAVGANVYVVWLDDFSGNQDIFFTKSTDGGNSFGKIINLSSKNNENTNNTTHSSFNPQLAVSGNNVYVVWQEDDAITGNQDIFFKKSTDNGNSFGPVNNLSRTDGDSLAPQIALSSGIESGGEGGEGGNNSTNIYLVWTDCLPKIVSDEPLCDILFTKSTDNGNSFGKIINLSSNTGSLHSIHKYPYQQTKEKVEAIAVIQCTWHGRMILLLRLATMTFSLLGVQMVGIASKVLRILVRLTELPVFKKWLLPLRAPFIWHGPT